VHGIGGYAVSNLGIEHFGILLKGLPSNCHG
jgi:hypothetical protein